MGFYYFYLFWSFLQDCDNQKKSDLGTPQLTAKRLVLLPITVDRKKATDSVKPKSPTTMTLCLGFLHGLSLKLLRCKVICNNVSADASGAQQV
jgi:hypothetical protein